MPVRLFVGNLPYDTTESDLRELFSPVGTLSAVIMPVDRETGKPRGFAFVEFSDTAQAEEASRRFNNQPFKGRNIAINEARAKENRPDSGPGARSGHPMRAAGTGRVHRAASAARPSLFNSDLSVHPYESHRSTRAERRSRNFGPDARTSRKQKSNHGSKGESGWKKRPIRERVGGQFFGSYEDDLYEDDRDLDYMADFRNTDEEDAV
jgi:cold-inducible RNA-binding protein